MAARTGRPAKGRPAVFIVSGGTGSSGELLVHTALAQFADARPPVVLVPRVRTPERVDEVVSQAAAAGGTIVHTLVDPALRRAMTRAARRRGVAAVDLMGPLLGRLGAALGLEPVGRPGLFRELHEAYFRRVDAIDFAMRHDDGQRPEELPRAEVVLLGVSRIGKTPLTMYLAVLGWKVANVPVLADVEPPAELDRVPRRRIVGLTIDADRLREHRRSRQRQMAGTLPATYADPDRIRRDLQRAAALYRRLDIAVIDVTMKPIETTAEEILAAVGSGTAEC